MKNDSNQEDTIDFSETAFSSVTMDSQMSQRVVVPSDSSNRINNNENSIRLIRINKPIQAIKYCSNSIRYLISSINLN